MKFDLAVLIGAPHDDDSSIHNDLVAMHDALLQSEMAPETILSLEGKLTHKLLLDFFGSVRERVAEWQSGSLFLYISGHGFFVGEDVQSARVGIELAASEQITDKYHLFWQEIFETLALPPTISLYLLPDH